MTSFDLATLRSGARAAFGIADQARAAWAGGYAGGNRAA